MAGYIIYSLDGDKFREFIEKPTPGQLAALAELMVDGLDEFDGCFEDGDPVAEWPSDAESLAPIAARRLAMADWYGDLSATGKDLWEAVVFSACSDCDEIDLGFRVDSDGVYWDVIETAWKHLGVVPNTITDVALSAFGTRPYRYQPSPGPEKTREKYDQDEDARKASLSGMSDVLGQFLEDVKQGKDDASPEKLFDKLDEHGGIAGEHIDALKGLLDDDDSDDEPEDEEANADDWSSMHSMHAPDEVAKMLAELRSVESAVRAEGTEEVLEDCDELASALEAVANDRRVLFVQVDT